MQLHIVYVLRSQKNPIRLYKGYTTRILQRLEEHNQGKVPSTAPYAPYVIIFYCVFPTREQAVRFEKYLKSGSGTAFMYKRLIK